MSYLDNMKIRVLTGDVEVDGRAKIELKGNDVYLTVRNENGFSSYLVQEFKTREEAEKYKRKLEERIKSEIS